VNITPVYVRIFKIPHPLCLPKKSPPKIGRSVLFLRVSASALSTLCERHGAETRRGALGAPARGARFGGERLLKIQLVWAR
jgi:hypothetical protein